MTKLLLIHCCDTLEVVFTKLPDFCMQTDYADSEKMVTCYFTFLLCAQEHLRHIPLFLTTCHTKGGKYSCKLGHFSASFTKEINNP